MQATQKKTMNQIAQVKPGGLQRNETINVQSKG
jgi:hypothetical protein